MEERRGGVCSERGEELLQCEWRRGGVAYARNAVKAFSLSEAGAATGGNRDNISQESDPNDVTSEDFAEIITSTSSPEHTGHGATETMEPLASDTT